MEKRGRLPLVSKAKKQRFSPAYTLFFASELAASVGIVPSLPLLCNYLSLAFVVWFFSKTCFMVFFLDVQFYYGLKKRIMLPTITAMLYSLDSFVYVIAAFFPRSVVMSDCFSWSFCWVVSWPRNVTQEWQWFRSAICFRWGRRRENKVSRGYGESPKTKKKKKQTEKQREETTKIEEKGKIERKGKGESRENKKKA